MSVDKIFRNFFEKMNFFQLWQPPPPSMQMITKPYLYFLIGTYMATLKHHLFPFNIARKEKYTWLFEKRAKVKPKFPSLWKKKYVPQFCPN